MNAKNALSAMNVNKSHLPTLLFAAMVGMVGCYSTAHANVPPANPDASVAVEEKNNQKDKEKSQAAKTPYVAASLYGIKEISINYPIFTDPRASSDCGLSRETLLTIMQRNLQDPNFDLVVLDDKRPRKAPRVTLTYEITTAKEQQVCLSWVTTRYTDQATLVLPPLKVPRILTLTFWQKSGVARSVFERHQTAVGDVLSSLGRQFLRDAKLAEPSADLTTYSGAAPTAEQLTRDKNLKTLQSINEDAWRRVSDPATGGADLPVDPTGITSRSAKPLDDVTTPETAR